MTRPHGLEGCFRVSVRGAVAVARVWEGGDGGGVQTLASSNGLGKLQGVIIEEGKNGGLLRTTVNMVHLRTTISKVH